MVTDCRDNILKDINTTLKRIADALENIEMKMCNPSDPGLEWVEDPIDAPKKNMCDDISVDYCKGCKYLCLVDDPITLTRYFNCAYYRKDINDIDVCAAKENIV